MGKIPQGNTYLLYTLLIYVSLLLFHLSQEMWIKWIIIGWTFTGILVTVLNISNKILLTMQEMGILSKCHGKMSDYPGYIK